jgi:hypothetical protein
MYRERLDFAFTHSEPMPVRIDIFERGASGNSLSRDSRYRKQPGTN